MFDTRKAAFMKYSPSFRVFWLAKRRDVTFKVSRLTFYIRPWKDGRKTKGTTAKHKLVHLPPPRAKVLNFHLASGKFEADERIRDPLPEFRLHQFERNAQSPRPYKSLKGTRCPKPAPKPSVLNLRSLMNIYSPGQFLRELSLIMWNSGCSSLAVAKVACTWWFIFEFWIVVFVVNYSRNIKLAFHI